jgi:heterodisulfide reductase subunit C
MTIRIRKKSAGSSQGHLYDRIKALSGADLRVCFQCKKCSCGCPVTDHASNPPSEIIRRIHLGDEEGVLNSDLVWTCASCETCSVRCPMGVDFASAIDAIKVLAVERKAKQPKGYNPVFNQAFLRTVYKYGRTYDLGMITAYKLRTGTFLKDMDKFPAMLAKRKIAVFPSRGGNKETVKRIFHSVKKNSGTSK